MADKHHLETLPNVHVGCGQCHRLREELTEVERELVACTAWIRRVREALPDVEERLARHESAVGRTV